MSRRTATWVLGALLGIVIAAAITWATSHLTAQHIGLSSEPLSAGRSLVPRLTQRRRQEAGATSTTITVTLTHTVSATGRGTSAPGASTAPPSPSSTTLTTSIVTTAHRSAPAQRDDSHLGEGGAQSGGARPHTSAHGPDD
jgi:hypothetical protein